MESGHHLGYVIYFTQESIPCIQIYSNFYILMYSFAEAKSFCFYAFQGCNTMPIICLRSYRFGNFSHDVGYFHFHPCSLQKAVLYYHLSIEVNSSVRTVKHHLLSKLVEYVMIH